MSTNPVSPYQENSFSEVVAGNIRARAARIGYNQSSFAVALSSPQSVINKKWRGVRPWKLDDLDSVARVLQCSPWDLTRPDYENPAQPKLSVVQDERLQRDSNAQPTDYMDELVGELIEFPCVRIDTPARDMCSPAVLVDFHEHLSASHSVA